MQCKLCTNEKKLIEAHIIPKSLYGPLQQGPLPLEMLTNSSGKYSKRVPSGIYDPTIICEECERLFSPWDDYAQKVFLKKYPDEAYIVSNGRRLALKVDDIDYHALKLFFISLLWRASVSTHDFFKRVNVGPFEAKLRQHILSMDAGNEETFAVILAQFDHPLGTVTLDPHRDRHNGINYIRFYMVGYIVYIKVDDRSAPEPLGLFKLTPDKPLIMLLRDFKQSKELRLIQKMLLGSRPT